MTNELTEIKKYEIDKTIEMKENLSKQRLEMSSLIKVGNENLASISLLADKFAKAGDMIPKEFQGNAEKCFAAIYKGASLGLDAFTSLQRIAVVNGRATIWGDTALALVRKSGELEHFKEYYGVWIDKKDMTPEELQDPENQLILKEYGGFVRKSAIMDFANKKFGAGCEVIRKGGKLRFEFFSVADAETAGLWGTNVWKKYPQRMIKYRPRAYNLRDTFADVLDGLHFKEEMEGAEELKDVTPSDFRSQDTNPYAKLKGMAWGKNDIKDDFPDVEPRKTDNKPQFKNYEELQDIFFGCEAIEELEKFEKDCAKDLAALEKSDLTKLSAMIEVHKTELKASSEVNINLNQL